MVEVPLTFSSVGFYGRSPTVIAVWISLDIVLEEGFGIHLLVMVGAFVLSEC